MKNIKSIEKITNGIFDETEAVIDGNRYIINGGDGDDDSYLIWYAVDWDCDDGADACDWQYPDVVHDGTTGKTWQRIGKRYENYEEISVFDRYRLRDE